MISETWIVPAITAFGGIAATILVQRIIWVHDKKKRIEENRRSVIAKARDNLSSTTYTKELYIKSDFYSQIRPYLSEETKRYMENMTSIIRTEIGPLRDTHEDKLMDEISALEKKWKLI